MIYPKKFCQYTIMIFTRHIFKKIKKNYFYCNRKIYHVHVVNFLCFICEEHTLNFFPFTFLEDNLRRIRDIHEGIQKLRELNTKQIVVHVSILFFLFSYIIPFALIFIWCLPILYFYNFIRQENGSAVNFTSELLSENKIQRSSWYYVLNYLFELLFLSFSSENVGRVYKVSFDKALSLQEC